MKNRNTYRGNLILTTLLVCSFFITNAQDYVRNAPGGSDMAPVSANKKFRLGVSIGPAIPMLDFGSTNVKGSFWDQTSVDSTHLQGFAKTGFHFDFYLSYLISDNFGLMLSVGGNSNSFDGITFSNTIGYSSAAVNGENFYTGEYLIGPFVYFPLDAQSKFSFSAYALIGLVSSNYPQISLAINDTITAAIQFLQGRNSFGFSAGATLAYSLNEGTDVTFGIGYTQSKIIYPSWSETFTAPGYYPATVNHPIDQTYMRMGILRPTVGIAFKF